MKKLLIILSIILGLLFLFFFFNREKNIKVQASNEENRAIFISYIELKKYLYNKNEEIIKKEIDKMIENVYNFNLNMIILQVRPFSDAIYESNYFPTSSIIVKNEGDTLPIDVLRYFIDISHEKGIKVHAWINPYRVRLDNDKSSISKTSIIYKWINDSSRNVYIKDGIYLNPAKDEVRDLIVDGVKEIVNNYDVDGILFDDYFYPNKEIDLVEYEEYKNLGGDLSITNYRYNNIYNLLKSVNSAIKSINNNVLFGISPQGNIENNKKHEYLNIDYVLKEKLIDYVMPQIYFGFNNTNKPFINTVIDWNDLSSNNIPLYVALAAYKINKEDKYAGSGKNEWVEESDILKRQIIISRQMTNYKGFSLYRYDNIFNNLNDEEIINLKELLKTGNYT